MAKLEIRHLQKKFGPLEVIEDFNLCVEDREFVSLLGPSGCGKSTILRIVAGLEELTCGDIIIGDQVVTHLEPKDRDVAMVFQNYALYPQKTVFENLAYGLRVRKIPEDKIKARVDDVVTLLQIASLLERKPAQLSGGQQQRVSMGRAIMREPAAFLFDEPLSNLDAKLRNHMRVEVRQLQKRLGITTLYVTHDQVEAMTMSDRIVVLNHGKIEQIGKPLDIYERPASLFVATFIGSPSMNLFAAQSDGQEIQLTSGETLSVPGVPAGEVIMGVRPERVRLSDCAVPDSLNYRILMVEELGAQKVIHGDLGGVDVSVVHNGDGTIPSGGAQLTLLPDYLHFFNPKTGKRYEQD